MYDLDAYRDYLQARNASPTTIKLQLGYARRIVARWPDLASVTAEDLAGFVWAPDHSRWTVRTYDSSTRAFFRWLTRTGQLAADPTIELTRPKLPKSTPRPLTTVEAERALAAASPDLRAALLLGMYAGLRAHEVVKIRGDEITQHDLYVQGKGGREDLLPVHPLIWAEHQTRGAGYWFPGHRGRSLHLTSDTLTARTSALFGALGIAGSFHRCRHYYGTSLVRAGVNLRVVQALMRHTSLATTEAYLGVDDAEKRAGILSLVA